MKRQEVSLLIVVCIFAALISWVIAGKLFKAPAVREGIQVPVVQSIPSTLPDIANDPTYSSFLNHKSLDLTQPVRIGANKNNQPFNGR